MCTWRLACSCRPAGGESLCKANSQDTTRLRARTAEQGTGDDGVRMCPTTSRCYLLLEKGNACLNIGHRRCWSTRGHHLAGRRRLSSHRWLHGRLLRSNLADLSRGRVRCQPWHLASRRRRLFRRAVDLSLDRGRVLCQPWRRCRQLRGRLRASLSAPLQQVWMHLI